MMILENCRVVDVKSGGIKAVAIGIDDGRIASLEDGGVTGGDTGSDKKNGAMKVPTIDMGGAYVLPGLMNCHVHLSIVFPFNTIDPNESPAITALRCQRRGLDALRAGVTTVRTVGDRYAADIHLRTMIRQGWVEGPRIISGGRSIAAGYDQTHIRGTLAAKGPEDFRKKAQQELAAGADHLKIFISGGIGNRSEKFEDSKMTDEEIAAVVAVAESNHTYVVAHASRSDHIVKAAKMGVRCFEHGYQLDRRAAEFMAQNGCCLCPTLCVTRSPQWMKAHDFEQWTIDKATMAGADHLESIRNAIKAGVKIVNGTDAPPGDENADAPDTSKPDANKPDSGNSDIGVNLTVREVEHCTEAGLSNLAAIQASTINCAELTGVARKVGVVESGYYADLIATRDNPLEDIRALRGIYFVMQAGRVVRNDEEAINGHLA